ncbi:MAG: DUF1553 domain-containing protein [Planctomycetaceae bacterium]|nr:DUF1553 domain-containing protein [Planctomycetaceae bacterium]
MPEDLHLEPVAITDTSWWSFLPLMRPEVPKVATDSNAKLPNKNEVSGHPIDAFISKQLREKGLSFSPQADRATLIRRAYFDLIGLPPTPEQIEAFVKDPAGDAYVRLIDQLLASPRYGERWARIWLDIVHYGDTHGYDKDKLRLNAWPYRDYVVRSFNADKKWTRFVQEQVAGDAMFPDSTDGIVAMGFISAGPWDFVGHAEVPESKTDGKIARHLDRDDMVRTTIESFCSLTVGCAQCHHHKFDPISQDDYYALQAVFAALDRADQDYFDDPSLLKQYRKLKREQEQATKTEKQFADSLHKAAGEDLKKIDQQISAIQSVKKGELNPAYGYHSTISSKQLDTKWVQVNLSEPIAISRIVLRPSFDNHNNIGAGFGFPVCFVVEVSNDVTFEKDVFRIDDPRVLSREHDFANPGILPVELRPTSIVTGQKFQFVRITATKLAPRNRDYNFALAELEVFDANGNNVTANATVSAKDSIEALPRWSKANLIDGIAPKSDQQQKLAELKQSRQSLLLQSGTPMLHQNLGKARVELAAIKKKISDFPKPKRVYSGTVHQGSGNFVGRGHLDGQPRPIFLLRRGDVNKPAKEVIPGSLSLFSDLPSRFPETKSQPEYQRRIALANWLTSPDNSLTWRSAVNRIWQFHFGTGIVATPNDFGHMGATPSHPELLDWLAVEFRDNGQSLKQMHRLMMTSRTYKQSSQPTIDQRTNLAMTFDANNRLLWKMTPRKLDAEAIRDSILLVSGKMNLKMGGPAFQDFIIEKPEHSPHYQYHLHDPTDPKTHRRSIYRFIVRSQLQPFMSTLDCADPSLSVPVRNESLTPLQALTLLNNGLVVTMSTEFAKKLESLTPNQAQAVQRGFYEATGRQPDQKELTLLKQYTKQNGLENYCRLLFNMNEFTFID